MRKRYKIFIVYCESLFYILHGQKLKGIKHWAGPIYEQLNTSIQSIQFYSESDAKKAIEVIKDCKCKLFVKEGSTFKNNMYFKEVEY